MSEFTYLDLQKARKAHGYTQWQLAAGVHVSEDTVKRWESGKVKPSLDDVSAIEHFLCAEGELLWMRWAYSNEESYRERHAPPKTNNLLESLVAVRHELSDVQEQTTAIERDAMDGKIDDMAQLSRYLTEAKEAQAALQQFIGNADALLKDRKEA